MSTPVLVTGAAGFIGFHLTRRLLAEGHAVVGADDLNDYYDPQLKRDRLAEIEDEPGFSFEKLDLSDRDASADLFERYSFDRVAHLAAQTGVRHSLENPHAYVDSNLVGFANVLEGCRHAGVEHLAFASSSSVYGANEQIPYATSDNVDHPISLYAATKKSGELLAHSYAHLYDLPVTGLRFFTVYGPWGRPDMAYFLFADAITRGEPIQVFGHGKMQRDFTYVGDVAEGVACVLGHAPERGSAKRGSAKCGSAGREAATEKPKGGAPLDASRSNAPYRIYNIGNGDPIGLMDFIGELEEALGREAKKEFRPMQPGDMRATWADTRPLREATGFEATTPLRDGIRQFADWYASYRGVVSS